MFIEFIPKNCTSDTRGRENIKSYFFIHIWLQGDPGYNAEHTGDVFKDT